MNVVASLVWAVVAVLGAGALSLLGVAVGRGGPLRSLVRAQAPTALVAALVGGAALTTLERPEPAWRGDAASGGLEQWGEVQAVGSDAVTVVEAPLRDGHPRSLRFLVEPGDRTFGQTEEERAELMATPESTGAFQGQEQWYAWSTLLPEPVTVPDQGFLSLTQWHQSASRCPPNLALLVAPGTAGDEPRLLAGVRGGDLDPTSCVAEEQRRFDLGPLPIGAWTDLVVHVRWSDDGSDGLLEVRRDGVTVLAPTRLATLYSGQHAYLKQGVYRSSTEEPFTLYVAGTRRDEREAGVTRLDCRRTSLRARLSPGEVWC